MGINVNYHQMLQDHHITLSHHDPYGEIFYHSQKLNIHVSNSQSAESFQDSTKEEIARLVSVILLKKGILKEDYSDLKLKIRKEGIIFDDQAPLNHENAEKDLDTTRDYQKLVTLFKKQVTAKTETLETGKTDTQIQNPPASLLENLEAKQKEMSSITEQLKNEMGNLTKKNENLELRITSQIEANEQINQLYSKKIEEVETLQNERTKLESENKNFQNLLADNKQLISKNLEKYKILKERYNHNKKQYQTLVEFEQNSSIKHSKEINKREDELDELSDELDSLRDILNQYYSYFGDLQYWKDYYEKYKNEKGSTEVEKFFRAYEEYCKLNPKSIPSHAK